MTGSAGTAARPDINPVSSCSSSFFDFYYYSNYDEACYANAGGLSVSIPQVSGYWTGHNQGFFEYEYKGENFVSPNEGYDCGENWLDDYGVEFQQVFVVYIYLALGNIGCSWIDVS